ncbi:MAG: DUF4097 family beta strand repeat-containing protein [Saprospiraceae bacterium]
MKRKLLKCSLLILLLPFSLIAGTDGEKVDKRITRNFTIQSNGRVELSNKYGNIDIAIGSSNQVKIDVLISVTAGTEKKAQEAIDRISVEFAEGNNRVSARTEIETSSGWTTWFNSGKINMDINYQVTVPADVFLDLQHKYGNIYLETTDRDITIDLAYGDLRLGDINAKLDLDMAYSDGRISQIWDGEIVMAYSDLEMEDAKKVRMDVKYTDIKSGTFESLDMTSAYSDLHAISIGDIKYNGKYDDFVVEQVGQIDAVSGYTGIIIGELMKAGKFDMRYGELKVDNIHRGFSRLDINTSYTGASLEFNSDASFTLDAETNYCGIRHNGLKVSENIEKSTSKILKASQGSGGGQVYARMNYGELILTVLGLRG